MSMLKFLTAACLFWSIWGITLCSAQNNTFPVTGNVGIGTTGPQFTIDIQKPIPEIRLTETTSGGKKRLGINVGVDNEIRFLSTYGSGGNYPFTFRFGGSVGEALRIGTNGNVGIGTSSPQAKLAVDGNILAKEIKVKTDISVPDYVFDAGYKVRSLAEVERYVQKHKHLPEIPSAKEIGEKGLDLAEMNLLLLKKVEELTLVLIEKEKIQTQQAARLSRQEASMVEMEQNIQRLMKYVP